jgi:hypothetical protein
VLACLSPPINELNVSALDARAIGIDARAHARHAGGES